MFLWRLLLLQMPTLKEYFKQVEYTTFSETICRMIHEIARQARELGIETTLWMANDYEVIDWAILHDIDYVSTDFPAKAVRYMTGVKEYR